MGIPKKEVYRFVDEHGAAAIKLVKEQAKIDIDFAIEAFLKDPANDKLSTALAVYEYHEAEGRRAQDILNRYCKYTNTYMHAHNMRDLLFKDSWTNGAKIRIPSVDAIKAETEDRCHKIGAEYSRIREACRCKKSGEVAKDFLKELGFDVKELEDLCLYPVVVTPVSDSFDTNLLFPDNKNNIRKEEN